MSLSTWRFNYMSKLVKTHTHTHSWNWSSSLGVGVLSLFPLIYFLFRFDSSMLFLINIINGFPPRPLGLIAPGVSCILCLYRSQQTIPWGPNLACCPALYSLFTKNIFYTCLKKIKRKRFCEIQISVSKKFYWNISMLICLSIVFAFFWVTKAQLSSCNVDPTACKA